MSTVGSPKGRNENTVDAAKPKHSPEIDSTEWWQHVKTSPGFRTDPLDKGGNGGLPVPKHHYVLGDASPFIFELGHHEDWSKIVWACYFGEDCINFTGSGQGGAIAAVFDIALTMACSSFFQNADLDEGLGVGPEAYCVTASLSVEYKAPVSPIPGVFRLDIVKDHINGKRITVRGELVNVGVPDKRKGTPDTVLAVGEAVGSNISAPRSPRL